MKSNKLKPMAKIFTFLLAFTVLAVGCKKDKTDMPAADVVAYSNVSLSTAQEVPSNSSSASGSLTASYDKTSNKLSYTITYAGTTATAMHFHKGAIGVSGGIAKEVPGPYSSGMTGSITLTEAQETDLLAGLWYLNIHSTAHAAGEIRGQVVPENIVVLSNVALNAKQEVPLNLSTATGVFNGFYNRTTKKVTYTVALTGITATAMHIHKGVVGVSGSIVTDLSASGGTTAALTAEQEADLLAGNSYVNVHSATLAAGEIRGQILPQSKVVFASAINGASEVPANISAATGSVYAIYDRSNKKLSYLINYAGLIATNMHFHKAAVGVSGGVALAIAAPYSTGMTGFVTLTAEQEADLLGGLWYLNIHSAAFAGGEIRAQLIK